MTDHEYLDNVSMAAVHALAEALQESLSEGAQTAVEGAVTPIKIELAETSHALKESAEEMNHILADAGDKLRRESQASISTFLRDEALPHFTQEIDRATKAIPNLESGITTLHGQVDQVASVLPVLQQGLVSLDQTVNSLGLQVKSEADGITGHLEKVSSAIPDLENELLELRGSLQTIGNDSNSNFTVVQERLDHIPGHTKGLVLGLEDKIEILRRKTSRVTLAIFFFGSLAVILQIWILWTLYHLRDVR